jgi:hypothetical protein
VLPPRCASRLHISQCLRAVHDDVDLAGDGGRRTGDAGESQAARSERGRTLRDLVRGDVGGAIPPVSPHVRLPPVSLQNEPETRITGTAPIDATAKTAPGTTCTHVVVTRGDAAPFIVPSFLVVTRPLDCPTTHVIVTRVIVARVIASATVVVARVIASAIVVVAWPRGITRVRAAGVIEARLSDVCLTRTVVPTRTAADTDPSPRQPLTRLAVVQTITVALAAATPRRTIVATTRRAVVSRSSLPAARP